GEGGPGRRFSGKRELGPAELREALAAWEKESGGRVALTGQSSVNAYAAMARESIESFYCSDVSGLIRRLGRKIVETPRFPNVTFLETPERLVFFDRREGLTASPIQVYLELMTGDKRDRETAEQVRRRILAR